MTILALFVVHLFFVDPDQRRIFAFIYLGIAAALVVADWRRVRHIFSGVAE
jgi:hypothetical protein